MRVRRETPAWRDALLLLAVLALACTACGSQATPASSPPTATAPPLIAEVKPTVTATPQAVRVLQVMPVAQVTRNDDYEFNNCGGQYPATRSLSEAAQVQMAVAIADGATQLTTSATAPIPADVKLKLAAEVEAAYQEALAAARATVSQTTLFSDAQERNYIVIVWEERLYLGTVSFPMDGVAYTTEYTYTLEVPRAGSVKPGICTA